MVSLFEISRVMWFLDFKAEKGPPPYSLTEYAV